MIDIENYRYERKFFISDLSRQDVETIIRFHPAFFSEIYYERFINNIYLDFLELNNFQDNIDGNSDRIKYRIRWYGEMLTEIEKPVFELKIKKGSVGKKILYQLNQFEFTKGLNTSKLKDIILNSSIEPMVKLSIQGQFPVLLNRYKKFRITIDDEQSFYKLNRFDNLFFQNHKDLSSIILEMKYDNKYDTEASWITNKLPFRLTKSSKYARGVQLLYV